MKSGVVILAAGASSRMGRSKQLLPWRATTVIHHLVRQWETLGTSQIVVAIAETDTPLQEELDRIGFPASNRVVNGWPDEGMFGSIRSAARWTGWTDGITHIAISLGDQPHLKQDTLRRLVAFSSARPLICQPAYNGRARHPVIIPKSFLDDLAVCTHRTLAEFLEDHQAQRASIEIDDPGLALDMDTPADYEKALLLPTEDDER